MTTSANDTQYDEALALAYAAGWADGPPTAQRVRAFVDASGRSALEPVGEIPRGPAGSTGMTTTLWFP